ncbi:hypothetical protein MMC11_008015 [Xylographa trunciseda]|nr:hypothetical protein [Xylographa trunciseda]
MSTETKTIACFGATGGCVGAALACALKEGHYCTARTFQLTSTQLRFLIAIAVARNPEKLGNFLANEHHVPPSAIGQRLTIFQGDVKDPAAVSKAVISPINQEVLVDVILSGVGAYPTFQWSIRRPLPLTDPTICETAIRTVFTALSDLSSAAKSKSTSDKRLKKPLLIVISTAGCGRRRGIPLPIYLPYHYLLGSPLMDKRRMEEVVLRDKGAHVRDFVVIRPAILTDGKTRGDSGLRVGWEWGAERNDQAVKEPGPEVGYYVSRKDVGTWIFEKVIVQGGWEGKCVYLTY